MSRQGSGTKKSRKRSARPPGSAKRARIGLKPPTSEFAIFTPTASEIVVGVVGSLGIDNAKIRGMISNTLSSYGYSVAEIRIAQKLIPHLAQGKIKQEGTAYGHAAQLIDLGNAIRTEARNNAVLATAVATEIASERRYQQSQAVAYIVTSLKRPEEVAELRRIYGKAFYLLGVHCERAKRVEDLTRRGTGMADWEAEKLVSRDEDEGAQYGQSTRATFHLADFFVADENNDDKLRNSIQRCLDLVFGNPFLTPTFNEFAMFMAFASSVRSADLSRQVGAVIARGNELLSAGANDCPIAGGGLYWPVFIGDRVDDLPRGRDYKRGVDSNAIEKRELVDSVLKSIPLESRARVDGALRSSRIRDITEYGRVVHAEMEALLACARSQVSCVGATLYCTTFPCHNCAKHIIAAGIEQVIYIEPYPKSKAFKFHDDSISADKIEPPEKKVRFKPFIGIGPRMFFDLFSQTLSSGRPVERKNDKGLLKNWVSQGAIPRIQVVPYNYRRLETIAVAYIKELTGKGYLNAKKKGQ